MSGNMKKLRGFAAMSPERRRELQSKGGKTRAESNNFFFNSETAREAGKKRWRVFIKKYGRKKMKQHLSRISRKKKKLRLVTELTQNKKLKVTWL